MADYNDQMNRLLYKLELLSQKQDDFAKEIADLRQQIESLKNQSNAQSNPTPVNIKGDDISLEDKEKIARAVFESRFSNKRVATKIEEPSKAREQKPSALFSNLEKFIGENLINKIGIAITIIGVAIGAKYSIENGLISPLTRIIIGYAMGVTLLGFGIKLKKNYESYSAVLVSGAIAIMYFITYSAYAFYALIPQEFAFVLMLFFTVFTVLAALHYNMQVIALIGLVGAYAVPFLLSEGSGKVLVLLSYIAIINAGVLVIAFKKYWKLLYYAAFVMTWIIFASFVLVNYEMEKHFSIALIFGSIYFVLFYILFVAYKVLKTEKFEPQDIVLLLSNSFIFYGLGYYVLDSHEIGQHLLGLFTVMNAVVHFGISLVFYKKKFVDRNVLLFAVGLTLVFITAAVPVQLDGNWVTLLWVGEAALLFWIGRSRSIVSYENISYVLMILSLGSLIQDWSDAYYMYYDYENLQYTMPVLNISFLTSMLYVACFAFINFWNRKKEYINMEQAHRLVQKMVSVIIPGVFLGVLYWSFRVEIESYWSQLYVASFIEIKEEGTEYVQSYWNDDLRRFKTIWVINYSFLFLSVLAWVNTKKIKNANLGLITLAFTLLLMASFLLQGLYILSELRESYTSQSLGEYYSITSFNIGIRYVSFVFVIALLLVQYKHIKQDMFSRFAINFKRGFDALVYVTVLWIASSELVTWMEIMKSEQSYKLGLSILWGLYALAVIVIGIWKNRKHLRIGAMALFAVTLLKLFFYDIAHLNTISKTIVLVSLGVLLLISSFLYNKYKHLISEENEN